MDIEKRDYLGKLHDIAVAVETGVLNTKLKLGMAGYNVRGYEVESGKFASAAGVKIRKV